MAWVTAVAVVLSGALIAAFVGALLLGDRLILLGDVLNWLTGAAGRQVSFVLDQRWPRVLAALLGGAALALAGAIVQAVCRNPLAEPSLLGVTPGASVGAVAVVLLFPSSGAAAPPDPRWRRAGAGMGHCCEFSYRNDRHDGRTPHSSPRAPGLERP